MRKALVYIQIVVLVGLAMFLFGFANQRNEVRFIEDPVIRFENEDTPFITREAVNKLLIQKDSTGARLTKEKLDLHEMEIRLREHPIIRSADVYVSTVGQVGVQVAQRKPIVRIAGSPSFYLDETGVKMPLSVNYSARVPIASGVSLENLGEVHTLVQFIKADSFLEKHITGIAFSKAGGYVLRTRNQPFDIILGDVDRLKTKFNNYAVFYSKAQKDKKLADYNEIDLRFLNQVVART